MSDFRYAVRQLRKNPGFSMLAVVVLSLAIGANTAVFRQSRPTQPSNAEVLMPYEQHLQATGTSLRLLIRTQGPPEALENIVRGLVRARSTNVPMRFGTMEQSLAEHSAAPRFRTILVSGFGVLALCLAASGVYGVLSYVVGQRLARLVCAWRLAPRRVRFCEW